MPHENILGKAKKIWTTVQLIYIISVANERTQNYANIQAIEQASEWHVLKNPVKTRAADMNQRAKRAASEASRKGGSEGTTPGKFLKIYVQYGAF